MTRRRRFLRSAVRQATHGPRLRAWNRYCIPMDIVHRKARKYFLPRLRGAAWAQHVGDTVMVKRVRADKRCKLCRGTWYYTHDGIEELCPTCVGEKPKCEKPMWPKDSFPATSIGRILAAGDCALPDGHDGPCRSLVHMGPNFAVHHGAIIPKANR